MSFAVVFTRQILLPLVVSVVCTILYDKLYSTYFQTSVKSTYLDHTSTFVTSVFCRGNNHTDRLCHFQNLCFEPKLKSFVFFLGTNSFQTGLPADRFAPTLIDFSSISDHNTQYFNYVELPQSSISQFNISIIQGHGLIFKRFNPDNLMHVFHDDLLPVYVTLSELSLLDKINDTFLVIADSRPHGAYSELYDNFLKMKPLYTEKLSSEYMHCFQNAYIGLNKQSTWYQYGFKEPQGPLQKPLKHISAIIFNFRDYFISQFSISLHNEKNLAVLFSRKFNRRILNEKVILQGIQHLTGLNTIKVSLDELPVLLAIEKVINSQLVIGMHGSIMILSLFLNFQSIVIELFPFGVSPDVSSPYKTLVELPGLDMFYSAWQNTIEENSFPHAEYPPEYGGIFHLPKEVQEKIKTSVVEPFLCCSNPVWLYRIYQDTIIDIHSFVKILQHAFKKRQISEFSLKSVTYSYSPSEVQNIECNFFQNINSTMILTWNQPWNVAFFNSSYLEYEVWIQDLENNNVHAFLLESKQFTFPVNFNNTYYVWVRCYADGIVGAFNYSPVICMKS